MSYLCGKNHFIERTIQIYMIYLEKKYERIILGKE